MPSITDEAMALRVQVAGSARARTRSRGSRNPSQDHGDVPQRATAPASTRKRPSTVPVPDVVPQDQTGSRSEQVPAPEENSSATEATAVGTDGAMRLEPEPVPALEFTVSSEVLKAAFAEVVGILPSRASLPALQMVLLATDGAGHLRITATDLDTTVSRRISVAVTEPGAALVPGRRLHEIARGFPDGCTLDVRLREDALLLWCKETRTRYRLPTAPVDEFPSPPSVNGDESAFIVPGSMLGLLIERVAFAASTEETRPILNGVLWEMADGAMSMVATDGHRLAVTRFPVAGVGGRPDAILHPRALTRVAQLYAGGETVTVTHAGNHLQFRGEGWELVTRLVAGPYPSYRSVLPSDNDRVLVADRGVLTAAIRRMAIVASDRTHRILFSLGSEASTLRISVETPDVGAGHEELAVDYHGGALEIGFNAFLLLEILRVLPDGEVRMTFKAPERAATLASVADPSGASSEYLVMPLRALG